MTIVKDGRGWVVEVIRRKAGMTTWGCMAYYAYILISCAKTGAFYVGVTNDLIRRIYQHREGLIPGFTQKYGIKSLVYYEIHSEIEQAILREKSIKRWTRAKKILAIEEMNPTWADLYATLIE